jgi:tetratricopeptide (TPR) repeat protein
LFLPLCACLFAADPPKTQEQEPPEEDVSLSAGPKEYVLNPLQAEKEMRIGNFYFKKGSMKAAMRRFEEATRWNPGYGEAFLRLGDARMKLGDKTGAREAYAKYLEIEPNGKQAKDIKKLLASK